MIALMGQLFGMPVALSLIWVWYKTRKQSKAPSDEAILGLSTQLEDLHRHIEAVAIEVERIAEGQRFTAKLLSERGESVPRRQ